MVRFALMAGMRLNNVVTLSWKQVDFDAEVVSLKLKSKQPGGRPHTVPITREMRRLLQGEQGQHPIFVFTYVCVKSRDKRKAGKSYPFSHDGWRKSWKEALDAAGISDFRFHDTRHTAATRTLRAGGNLKVVKEMLGHTDIATTNRYAHVTNEDVRDAMEKAQCYNSTTRKGKKHAKP